MESVHDNPAASEEFSAATIVDVEARPGNGSYVSGVIDEQPDRGPVTLVSYFVREGHELPPLSEDESP